MVQKTVKDGIVHFYSDQEKKIHRKGSGFLVNNAFEEEGKEHEWEEEPNDETGSN